MSLNEEMFPTTESFWEIGKYSRTVKRFDNGHKLCTELRSMIEQRAEIEKSYSKQLTAWSKKWNEYLDKGPEYGTTQGSWRGVLHESQQLSGLHMQVAERLMKEVYQSIKAWQKETYIKSRMSVNWKQTKELEDGFRKAQKPWEKKYKKVCLARTDYHNACKSEKSTANHENNAKGDNSMSPEQLKKLSEKLKKLSEDVQNCKTTYEAALADLNSANPKYMEEMAEVFEKCQESEKDRIMFIKDTMLQIHERLDLSADSRFPSIYSDLHSTICKVDHDHDLKWWSVNHGTDMAMNWPQFEEYSPGLAPISKKNKFKQGLGGDDGIQVKSIKRDTTYLNNPEPAYNNTDYNNQPQRPAPQQNTTTTTTVSSTNIMTNRGESPDIQNQNGKNPFGEDTESDDDQQEFNSGTVMVRALYDYEKQDADELSLKTGDVLAKLADEDDMGWAKGKLNGIIGLYPAHYVEEVTN